VCEGLWWLPATLRMRSDSVCASDHNYKTSTANTTNSRAV
jgi:hypothetical protein